MKGIFLVLLISVFISGSHGQGSKNLKKTEALFLDAKNKAQAGEAEKAIDLLNQLLRIDPAYYMAHFALADIYHEKGKLDLEEKELNEGLKVCGDAFPNGYKFLAQILYKKGEYAEAFNNINKYLQINKSASPDDRRLFESCSFAKEAVQHPVPFQPENLGQEINTVEDEYFPCLDGEGRQLVFTRLLKTSADGQKLPFPQEDLFRSVKDSDKWRNAQPLDALINTPENEGAQCISADGKLLFFTACGRKDGLGSCDIYMAVRKQGRWSEPVNLGAPVNSNAWETQPSVSSDGHFLYFTSNRKGGKGKMDIWRAEKIGVTSSGYPVYGKVINLENINTPGDELSPFIHADGKTLFFASDYWPGMGGKDLFKATIEKDKISTPLNLGYPINTKDNEEGLVVETSGETAFFTSNAKGFGGRDIFSFNLPQNIKPEKVSYVKGKVVDHETGKTLLPQIKLSDLSSNQELQQIYPFENEGDFLLCLPIGKNYGLSLEKEGYLFTSNNFNLQDTHTKADPLLLNISMDPIKPGKTTILHNIFFDTNSAQLKPESETQLNQMVLFLNNNKNLVIEIGGHTDNVGTQKYNEELSQKRAEAVVKYLIDKGIPEIRVKSKGYGFSKPVADNSTEEGRANNRRTEFKILEKQN